MLELENELNGIKKELTRYIDEEKGEGEKKDFRDPVDELPPDDVAMKALLLYKSLSERLVARKNRNMCSTDSEDVKYMVPMFTVHEMEQYFGRPTSIPHQWGLLCTPLHVTCNKKVEGHSDYFKEYPGHDLTRQVVEKHIHYANGPEWEKIAMKRADKKIVVSTLRIPGGIQEQTYPHDLGSIRWGSGVGITLIISDNPFIQKHLAAMEEFAITHGLTTRNMEDFYKFFIAIPESPEERKKLQGKKYYIYIPDYIKVTLHRANTSQESDDLWRRYGKGGSEYKSMQEGYLEKLPDRLEEQRQRIAEGIAERQRRGKKGGGSKRKSKRKSKRRFHKKKGGGLKRKSNRKIKKTKRKTRKR
jgi:hypothetical protein